MRFKLLTAVLLALNTLACAHAPASRQKTGLALAEVERKGIEVTFLGGPLLVDELYVCKAGDARENYTLACVPFVPFMEQLQEQQDSGDEGSGEVHRAGR